MELLKMPISVLIVFVGLIINQSYAQDVEFKRSGNWEFLYEIDGVNFYYKTCDFNDVFNGIHQENVLLKFENTNDSLLQVEWTNIFYYNGKCFNCDKKDKREYYFSVLIEGNSSVEGQCDKNGYEYMKFFSRFLNSGVSETVLTSFDLLNIKIVKK